MSNYLDVPSSSGASTPDQAGLAAGTSTLDIRLELQPTGSWASGFQALVSQDNGGGTGSRFWSGLTSAGRIEYDFYNSAGGVPIASSDVLGYGSGSAHGVRILHNIAAGTVDFYDSPDFTVWTPIGAQVTGLVTTGMATAGTAPIVRIGTDAFAEPMVGRITKVQVLVNGVTILNMDFTTATLGNGPWTATSGETWTRIGTASVQSASATLNISSPSASATADAVAPAPRFAIASTNALATASAVAPAPRFAIPATNALATASAATPAVSFAISIGTAALATASAATPAPRFAISTTVGSATAGSAAPGFTLALAAPPAIATASAPAPSPRFAIPTPFANATASIPQVSFTISNAATAALRGVHATLSDTRTRAASLSESRSRRATLS